MMKRPTELEIIVDNNIFSISFPAVNRPIDMTGKVAERYDNILKFNYFFANFGAYFDETRNSQIEINEENQYWHQGISRIHLGDEQKNAFQEIKYFANLPGGEKTDFNAKDSRKLLEAYDLIYNSLEEEFRWVESDAFMVPLRGGGVVARLFDLPENKVIHLNAKRLPLSDQTGNFALGMDALTSKSFPSVNEVDGFMNSLTDKTVTMLEICVASGMTTYGFLIDLYARGVRPKKIRIVAAAISLQGVQYVQRLSDQLDFKVEFITGKVVSRLADHYNIDQDSLLYPDGKFVVLSPAKAFEALYKTTLT